MHLCKQCGKKFKRRQHLARHRSKVHPPPSTDTNGGTTRAQGSKENCKRTHEDELPGDYWPSSQQVVIATGQAGDLLPWSSEDNIMLLAPSAICGVLVPKKWTSAMAVRDHGRFTEDLTGDPEERRTPARDPAEGAESGASPLPAATGGGEGGVTWEQRLIWGEGFIDCVTTHILLSCPES